MTLSKQRPVWKGLTAPAQTIYERRRNEKRKCDRRDREAPEGPAVVFTWKSLTFIPRVCKIDNEVHDEVFLALYFSSQ